VALLDAVVAGPFHSDAQRDAFLRGADVAPRSAIGRPSNGDVEP
jgi:hypothetical protein